MSAPLPRLLTSLQVADWLTMTTRRVERLARQGQIPHIRLPDGEMVFDVAELSGWLDGLRQENAASARAGSACGEVPAEA